MCSLYNGHTVFDIQAIMTNKDRNVDISTKIVYIANIICHQLHLPLYIVSASEAHKSQSSFNTYNLSTNGKRTMTGNERHTWQLVSKFPLTSKVYMYC